MTEEAHLHFVRAADCVEDARILIDNNRPAAATTRAYYAMFHAATAVLAIKGIKRSFEYLKKDKEALEQGFEIRYQDKSLSIIQLHTSTAKVKAADITLKKLGYLLSASQRQEITKEDSLVIGGEWAVEMQNNLLYIAPYLTVDMPKKFKEACRIAKIPTKTRPYLFQENIDLELLIEATHTSF